MRPVLVLLAAAVVVSGCGGGDPGPSTEKMEREIRGQFEQAAAGDGDIITVRGVSCVRKSPGEAACQVRGETRDEMGLPAGETLDLVVDIDPESGRFQWRVAD